MMGWVRDGADKPPRANTAQGRTALRQIAVRQVCDRIDELHEVIEGLERDNAKLRSVLDFQDVSVGDVLDDVYTLYRDRIETLETRLRSLLPLAEERAGMTRTTKRFNAEMVACVQRAREVLDTNADTRGPVHRHRSDG